MDMSGERLITASRVDVWAALNNIEILKACIPGCEKIESISDTLMKASAAIKVGPITAKLQGSVTLSDIVPPEGYKLSFSGQGAAGFAKGSAVVTLLEQEDKTLLRYTADTQMGGKLAQLGGRLIDSTAKSMTEQFFKKFAVAVEGPTASADNQVSDVHGLSEQLSPLPQREQRKSWFASLWAWLSRAWKG